MTETITFTASGEPIYGDGHRALARQRGRAAADAGEHLTDNPFADALWPLRAAWADGWKTRRRELEPELARAKRQGYEARQAGQLVGTLPPLGAALEAAWLSGFHARTAPPEPEPVEPTSAPPAARAPRAPGTFLARHEYPCPKCRCVELADGRKAVTLKATTGGTAYLACRRCGHDFKLPLERPPAA